ncbi:hypothetical protein PRUPE_3G142700 [Prunus persica]|uniref:Uncharacterized protein n=1 Tax=Prunus persica TaxID=3760 RepID=A0A251Q030_PRUPE|nr:hypothetical protein PRUPE_3G142700 [Prunus persica]
MVKLGSSPNRSQYRIDPRTEVHLQFGLFLSFTLDSTRPENRALLLFSPRVSQKLTRPKPCPGLENSYKLVANGSKALKRSKGIDLTIISLIK